MNWLACEGLVQTLNDMQQEKHKTNSGRFEVSNEKFAPQSNKKYYCCNVAN